MTRTALSTNKNNLIIKGAGYTSPLNAKKSQNENKLLAPTKPLIRSNPPLRCSNTTQMRRAGSMSNVASSSIQSRVPLIPQTHYNKNHSSTNQISGTVICNCQHPSDVSFLENIYVQNLQTQIEVLELENNFLKGGATFPTHPKSILRSGEEAHKSAISIPTNHLNIDDGIASTSTAYKTPINIPTTSSKINYSANEDYEQTRAMDFPTTTSRGTGKRVEFAEKSQKSYYNEDDKAGTMYTVHKSATTNDLIAGSTRSFHDEDLFLKLEQSFQNEHLLEEKLNAQLAENRKLFNAKTDLEERLRIFEGKQSRERRSLLEDNIELQRRLDELTPLLAEKAARIAHLEDEKEGISSRLRSAGLQIASLQAKLEEKKREETFYSELETDQRRNEKRFNEKVANFERQIQEKNHEIRELKNHQEDLNNEIDKLNQRRNDIESLLNHERSINQKLKVEKTQLQCENNDLMEQIRQHEIRATADMSARKRNLSQERELNELREIEEQLRMDLKQAEEQLKREQNTLKILEIENREREVKDQEHRDSRHRSQKELEALQALSNSLTNENKGLRQEKIAINERIEHLQAKLNSKENDLNDLAAKLAEFRRKYTESIERLRLEVQRQNETSHELETIVQNVHALAEFVPQQQHHQQQQHRPISSCRLLSPLPTSSSHNIFPLEISSFSSTSSAQRHREFSSASLNSPTRVARRESSSASLNSPSSSSHHQHQQQQQQFASPKRREKSITPLIRNSATENTTETVSAVVRSEFRISPIPERLTPLSIESAKRSPTTKQQQCYSIDQTAEQSAEPQEEIATNNRNNKSKRQNLTIETISHKISSIKPKELRRATTQQQQQQQHSPRKQQQEDKAEQLAMKYRRKIS